MPNLAGKSWIASLSTWDRFFPEVVHLDRDLARLVRVRALRPARDRRQRRQVKEELLADLGKISPIRKARDPYCFLPDLANEICSKSFKFLKNSLTSSTYLEFPAIPTTVCENLNEKPDFRKNSAEK